MPEQIVLSPPFGEKDGQKPFSRSHASRVRPAAERGRSARAREARRSASEALPLRCGASVAGLGRASVPGKKAPFFPGERRAQGVLIR